MGHVVARVGDFGGFGCGFVELGLGEKMSKRWFWFENGGLGFLGRDGWKDDDDDDCWKDDDDEEGV